MLGSGLGAFGLNASRSDRIETSRAPLVQVIGVRVNRDDKVD
jgi:hypothetical protein